jgi:hypothetical protein
MRSITIALIAAPALLSTACFHKTQLAATWHEPQALPLHFQHGVAIFVTRDEALRRSVEDRLVSQFPNMTPSYRVVPVVDSTTPRQEAVAFLKEAGFDGAIIMRVVDVSITQTYVAGNYWYGRPYGFAGYWGDAWASPYDPGYVVADRVVTVETQIYSLAKDQLLFAARSETTNPSSAKELTKSVIRHIREQLHKDGLLVSIGTTRATT